MEYLDMSEAELRLVAEGTIAIVNAAWEVGRYIDTPIAGHEGRMLAGDDILYMQQASEIGSNLAVCMLWLGDDIPYNFVVSCKTKDEPEESIIIFYENEEGQSIELIDSKERLEVLGALNEYLTQLVEVNEKPIKDYLRRTDMRRAFSKKALKFLSSIGGAFNHYKISSDPRED